MEKHILKSGVLAERCELTIDLELCLEFTRTFEGNGHPKLPPLRLVYYHGCGLAVSAYAHSVEEAETLIRKEFEKEYIDYTSKDFPERSKECDMAKELSAFIRYIPIEARSSHSNTGQAHS